MPSGPGAFLVAYRTRWVGNLPSEELVRWNTELQGKIVAYRHNTATIGFIRRILTVERSSDNFAVYAEVAWCEPKEIIDDRVLLSEIFDVEAYSNHLRTEAIKLNTKATKIEDRYNRVLEERPK